MQLGVRPRSAGALEPCSASRPPAPPLGEPGPERRANGRAQLLNGPEDGGQWPKGRRGRTKPGVTAQGLAVACRWRAELFARGRGRAPASPPGISGWPVFSTLRLRAALPAGGGTGVRLLLCRLGAPARGLSWGGGGSAQALPWESVGRRPARASGGHGPRTHEGDDTAECE